MPILTEIKTNLELSRAAMRVEPATERQVAAVANISRSILKAMGRGNHNDREARLEVLGQLLGRKMISTKYLFRHEAHVILGAAHRFSPEQFAEELSECILTG